MNIPHCLVCGFVFGQSIFENKASNYEQLMQKRQTGSDRSVLGNNTPIENAGADIVVREHCIRIPYKIKCMGNHHVCNFCLGINIAEQHNNTPHVANPTPIVIICDICPKHKNSDNQSPEPDLELLAKCLKNNEKSQYEIERVMNKEKTAEMIQLNHNKISNRLNRFVFKCMGCDGNGCTNNENDETNYKQQEQKASFQSNKFDGRTNSESTTTMMTTSSPLQQRGISTMSARGRLISTFCNMNSNSTSSSSNSLIRTPPPPTSANMSNIELGSEGFVRSSSSLIKPSSSMSSIVSSSSLVDNPKVPNATIMCKNCRLICCDKCHRQKHDQVSGYTNLRNATNMICDNHGQVIKIYCLEHMEFICSECFIKDPKKSKHKFHHHIVFMVQDEAQRIFTMFYNEFKKCLTYNKELLINVKSTLETYSMGTRNFAAASEQTQQQHVFFNMRILDGQKNRLEQTLALITDVMSHLEEFIYNVTRFKFIDYDSRNSNQKLTNLLNCYLELAKSCNKIVMKSMSDINQVERSRSRTTMFEVYNKNRFM